MPPGSFEAYQLSSAILRLENLGAIDAETDFRPDFFVPSSSWERVRGRRRPVVVGRKGTGKTALRKALLDVDRNDATVFATDLAFRDYPWNAHAQVFDANVGGTSRYLETWLFLMLIELAKQAIGVNQAPPADPDAAEGLGKFIRLNWGSLAFDHRDTFRAKDYQVTGSLQPSVAGTGFGGASWTKVSRERLGDSLSSMNKWLKEALDRVLLDDAEHFLLFDELDLDFDPGDESYRDSVIGLLLAAQHLHQWGQAPNRKVMPVVLLRDDIFNGLRFPDKNKITTNLVERIQWTDAFGGPNSLKTVVDTRIRVLLGSSAADPWLEVFDDDVMRGTQHKYSHMAQRTYLRPRDLIQFGNLCLDAARERLGNNAEGSSRVTNEDVTTARFAYSKYLRDELDDEIHAHYPNWEQWMELLRRVGTLTFRRSEFDAACDKATKLAEGRSPAEILEALYTFSIIGFSRFGGRGRGGTNEYWRYREPEVAFDADAPYFKVHPGLKEHLDLKEERH